MSPTAILRKVSNKASKLMRARTCRLVAIVILASLACWAVATGYQATISQRGPNSRSDARDERWPAQTLRRGTPYDSQARYEVINHLLKEKRTVWLPWKPSAAQFVTLAFNVYQYDIVRSPTPPNHWDVWWTPLSPVRGKRKRIDQFTVLRPEQKVHYIPGNLELNLKVNLVTSRDISFITPGFRLPDEKDVFLDYASRQPDSILWLQKHIKKGGVRLTKPSEIDFLDEQVFVQQYVPNPLLLDNRKFDIGIFMVVTSVIPLRMYTYFGDYDFKFCFDPYLPFNPNHMSKYREEDDFLFSYSMPSLKTMIVRDGKTSKEAFDSHLRSRGMDPLSVETSILKASSEVGMKKDAKLSAAAMSYNLSSYHQFFQLMRYDMVLDTNLKPWIIELNGISVSLSIVRGWKLGPHFEGVLVSTLNLVGVAGLTRKETLADQVSDADINVDSEDCVSNRCNPPDCGGQVCPLCFSCLSSEDKDELRRACLEHQRRGPWRRAVPPPFKDQNEARQWNPEKDDLYQGLTKRTKFITRWFHKKCLNDASWCH